MSLSYLNRDSRPRRTASDQPTATTTGDSLVRPPSDNTADRLLAETARRQQQAARDAAEAQEAAQEAQRDQANYQTELKAKRDNRETITNPTTGLREFVRTDAEVAREKQKEQSLLESNAATERRYRQAGRSYYTDKVTGAVVPVQDEKDWQKELAQQAKAKRQQRRRDKIDQEVTERRALLGDPANQTLRDTERKELDEQRADLSQSLAYEVAEAMAISDEAKAEAGGFLGIGADKTPGALAIAERAAELNDPESGATPDADEVKRWLGEEHTSVQTLAEMESTIAADDERRKTKAQIESEVFDAELRRDNPEEWKRRRSKQLDAMSPPERARAIEQDEAQQESDFLTRASDYDARMQTLQAEEEQAQQALSQIQTRNTAAKQQGLRSDQMVTLYREDGTSEVWERGAAEALTQWQNSQQDRRATMEPQLAELNEERAELQAEQAALTERQNAKREAATEQRTQARAEMRQDWSMREHADELDEIDAEQAERTASIAERHAAGELSDDEAAAARMALETELTTRTEGVIQSIAAESQGREEIWEIASQSLDDSVLASEGEDPDADQAESRHQRGWERIRAKAEELGIDPIKADRMARESLVASQPFLTVDEDGERIRARVLPSGTVQVDPTTAFESGSAYRDAVMATDATPEEKQRAMDKLPALRNATAPQMVRGLRAASPAFRAWEEKQSDIRDYGELMERYLTERGGVGKAIDRVTGAVVKGLNDAAGQFFAFGAMVNPAQLVSEKARELSDQVLTELGDADEGSFTGQSQMIRGALVDSGGAALGVDLGSAAVSMMPALASGGIGQLTAKGTAKLALKTSKLGVVGRTLMSTVTKQGLKPLTSRQAVALANKAGMGGAGAGGFVQSFGAVYPEAVGAYRAEGLTIEEAREKALLPATSAGLATTLLTIAGGARGVESVFRKDSPAMISQAIKAIGKDKISKAVRSKAFRKQVELAVKDIAGDFTQEAWEEGADEFYQGLLEQAQYGDGEATLGDVIQQSLYGALLGGLLGGGMSTAKQGAGAIQRALPERKQAPGPKPEDIAIAEQSIEQWEAPEGWSPEDAEMMKGRARVLLKVAQGTEAIDLSNEELSAIGLERSAKGEVKPVTRRGTEGNILPPVAVENGRLLVTDASLTELAENFPKVRDLVSMSETEARRHFAEQEAQAAQAEAQAQAEPATTEAPQDAAPEPEIGPDPSPTKATDEAAGPSEQEVEERVTLLTRWLDESAKFYKGTTEEARAIVTEHVARRGITNVDYRLQALRDLLPEVKEAVKTGARPAERAPEPVTPDLTDTPAPRKVDTAVEPWAPVLGKLGIEIEERSGAVPEGESQAYIDTRSRRLVIYPDVMETISETGVSRILEEEVAHAISIDVIGLQEMGAVFAEVAKVAPDLAVIAGQLYGVKTWENFSDVQKGAEVVRMVWQRAYGRDAAVTETATRRLPRGAEKALDKALAGSGKLRAALDKVLAWLRGEGSAEAGTDALATLKRMADQIEGYRTSVAGDAETTTTETEAAPKKKTAKKKGTTKRAKVRKLSLERPDTPVLNALRLRPIVAKNAPSAMKHLAAISKAKRTGMPIGARARQFLSDYDGQPKLADYPKDVQPYLRGIFQRDADPTTSAPDKVANALMVDDDVPSIGEGATAIDLYEAITAELDTIQRGKDYTGDLTARDAAKYGDPALLEMGYVMDPFEGNYTEEQAQDARFEMDRASPDEGTFQIKADTLEIGDEIEVDGELLQVQKVAPNGDVTLEDGEVYGTQNLSAEDVLYVDLVRKLDQGETDARPEDVVSRNGAQYLDGSDIEQAESTTTEEPATQPAGNPAEFVLHGSRKVKGLMGRTNSKDAYIIDVVKPGTNTFVEHLVLRDYSSAVEAREVAKAALGGEEFIGSFNHMTKRELAQFVGSQGNPNKPHSSKVKVTGAKKRKADLQDAIDNAGKGDGKVKFYSAPSLSDGDFTNPPSDFTFVKDERFERQYENEWREIAREIDRGSGQALRSVKRASSEAIAQFEVDLALAVRFYDGDVTGEAGFVADAPRLPDHIFVNQASDMPVGWTLGHELAHVSRKDPSTGYAKFAQDLVRALNGDEVLDIARELLRRGYTHENVATELPAFFMGDLLSGDFDFINSVGPIRNLARIKTLVEEFYESLPRLSPTNLRSDPDSELSRVGDPLAREVDSAAKQTERAPTEAQKEAGNYKMGHVRLHGYDVSIENPRGSMRRGKDADGKAWAVKLQHHYGYLRGTTGVDGDHVDVFIGPNPKSEIAYVVYQNNAAGTFDEHKVMLGFETAAEAEAGYLANYADGWAGLGKMEPMTMPQFKEWVGKVTPYTGAEEYADAAHEQQMRDRADMIEPADAFDEGDPYALQSAPSFDARLNELEKKKDLTLAEQTELEQRRDAQGAGSFSLDDDTRPAAEIEAERRRDEMTARQNERLIGTDAGTQGDMFGDDQGLLLSARAKRDADYLEAVESGDMETAQRMVDEAAKAAGYDSPKLYHETDKSAEVAIYRNGFDPTRINKMGAHGDTETPRGIFLKESKEWFGLATKETSAQIPVFIKSVKKKLFRNRSEAASYRGEEKESWKATREEFREKLISEGYDTVVLHNDGFQKSSYIVFNPNQIKSADPVTRDESGNVIPLSQRFDPSTDSILYSAPADPPSPFYSNMSRVIDAKIQGRQATPEQLKALITNPQNRVKAEEVKWTGVIAKIDELAIDNGGKVPMEALRDWLAADGVVRFEEVSSGVDGAVEQALKRHGYTSEVDMDGERGILDSDGEHVEFDDLPEEVQQALTEKPAFEQKYGQYTLPGGKNYREVVLAMPAERLSPSERAELNKFNERPANELNSSEKARANELLDKIAPLDTYTSSHFNTVPNYVAHMRTNERADSKGDQGLFIEEIQSDRHQEGRQKGYAPESERIDTLRERQQELQAKAHDATTEEKQEWADIMNELTGEVADAPFRKDWPLQMFKRALRDAVEGGKTWIGWTVGETQSERFDLSKQISRVTYTSGAKVLRAYNSDGERVLSKRLQDPSEIENYIGKDPARRLLEAPQTEISSTGMIGKGPAGHMIEGEDLKVGGEGMKGFYDKMLPKEVQKYVKQWGAKVTIDRLKLTGMPESEYEGYSDGHPYKEKNFPKVWRVDITPEMKASVESGQPLFSAPAESRAPRQPGELMLDRAAKDLASFTARVTKLADLGEAIATHYHTADYLTPARRAVAAARKQFTPLHRLAPEANALLNEMRVNQAFAQERALDVVRSVKGNQKFSDLAWPKEYANDKVMRKRLFLAMSGEIDMDTLPEPVQEIGNRMRSMLQEAGLRAVQEGRMHPDTYQALTENYVPHYFFQNEAERSTLGGLFKKFAMGVGDIKAQRLTGYRIEDNERTDADGLPRLITWSDGTAGRSGRKGRWRFESIEQRDAFYEDFIRRQAATEISGRDGMEHLTARHLEALESLPDEQRGYARRVMDEMRARYTRQSPMNLEGQEEAGLIMDPVYATARYIGQMEHDNATAEFFNEVAKRHDEANLPADAVWVSETPVQGFELIPDNSRFGRLANRYVREDVAEQVLELVQSPDSAAKIYDSVLSLWKTGKTVYNPGTHVRNVLGNVLFAQMAGLSPFDSGKAIAGRGVFPKAWKTIRDGGEDLETLYQHGVLGGDFLTAELRKELSGILPADVVDTQGGKIWLKIGVMAARAFQKSGGATAKQKIEGAYQLEDELFKAAAFFKAKEKGMSNEEAAEHVRKWFPYYDHIGTSSSIKAVRRTAMPFFSFQREAIRILGNAARERPITLAASMAIPAAISTLSAMLLGLDDEEDRDRILAELRGKGRFFATDTSMFSMLLPKRDAEGRLQQFDLTNVLPFASLLGRRIEGADDKPLWQQLALQGIAGSPLTGIPLELAMNQDTFSGRPIWEDNMSDGEKVGAVAKNIHSQLAPPLFPGGTSWNMVANRNERSSNKSMEKRNATQTLLRSLVGIDIRNASPNIYKLADDYREANGLLRGDYVPGGTTPESRARANLFAELVQDEPDLPAIRQQLEFLRDEMGKPIETKADVNRLLFFRNPLMVIKDSKQRERFFRTQKGEAKVVLDDAVKEFDRVQKAAYPTIRRAMLEG